MEEYILWYVLLQLSNRSKLLLLNKYKNEENIYNNIDNIIKSGIIKGNTINNIKLLNKDKIKLFDKHLKDNNIGYITINSKDYPRELLFIEEPPYILFYKGDLSLLKNRRVAIVGARQCTCYGKEVAKAISVELTKNLITIVSGLASGIDAIAHKETLNYGKTIAVLGCGIDVVYPKSNSRLYKDVEKNGLILSEFLPGTKPFSYNFPRRNRIISGLSEAIIVIEASLKSGSLITVSFALEQGKDVMAVPGSVLQKYSLGCNKLIRDGAIVFTELEDLYTMLSIEKKKIIENDENSIKSQVLSTISSEPSHLDDIMERVKVDRKVLFELLFEMQNTNEIICLPGNYYAKLT
ncbi:DNA-processing protein DprA [Clostridium chauvoei]|uniref:DNA-processing protein DprA n=1 Tax=Clostridium chauvoei TaxID=46867 RepID=UPI001C853E8D|nr:DNA-processing protein DprA [Clostridium chauvoei]MBX7382337.1 DNA-processing protein DprA [Clostridium chauvoei]